MKEQGVARRRQMIYGAQEVLGGRSSTHSLASNMTGGSSNSWGSASTVTQDSYARSRQPGEKKRKTRKRGDGERKLARRMSEVIDMGKDVDVFEFLVEEEEPDSPHIEPPRSAFWMVKTPDPDTHGDEAFETKNVADMANTDAEPVEPTQAEVFTMTEIRTKTPEMQSRRVSSPWIAALRAEAGSPNTTATSSEPDMSAIEDSDIVPVIENEPEQAIISFEQPESTNTMTEDTSVEHDSARDLHMDRQLQVIPSTEKIDDRLPAIEAQLIELTKSQSLDNQMHALDVLTVELARLSALRSDTPSQAVHTIKMPTPELQRSSNMSSPYQLQETMSYATHHDLQKYHPNKLSDSGISMGSETDEPHSSPFSTHPLPALVEEVVDYPNYNEYQTFVPPIVEPYHQHEPQMWNHLGGFRYTPEPPMPLSPASIRHQPYSHDYAYRGTPDPPSPEETSRGVSVSRPESTPLVFQDRVEASQPHPLLFRSFANVNARVLLQMQSNISDLEHALLTLDAKIGSAGLPSGHKKENHGKSSRRFNKDQARRADLYQELNTSLQQYYESLSSFNQMKQITTPSKSGDLSNIKVWLKSNLSSPSKIESLTGDGADLVRLGHPPNEVPEEILHVVAYCVFTNVFLPLVLFKMSSGVLSRLILLSLTTTIATLAMDRHRNKTEIELGNLYWQCIVGCVGFCFVVALFF